MRWLVLGLAVALLTASCSAGSSTPTTTSALPSATTGVSAAPDVRFDVQGHRGARGLQPENTLPAFEAALDIGATTLELDLHFTADARVVVWHDAVVPTDKCELKPTAIATDFESEPATADLTLEELQAFRCAMNPDLGRFPEQAADPTPLAGDNYTIVTLAELFEFVAAYAESDLKTDEQRAGAAQVHFNVETKRVPDRPETINDGFDGTNAGPFETAILEEIAAKGLGDRVTVQSFDHRSLRAIRSINESIQLAALTRRNEPFQADFADFAQIWSPDYRSLSGSSLNDAQAAGMLVIPWTVNETKDMNRLIDLGVDGLITDRPDLLVQEIAGRQ